MADLRITAMAHGLIAHAAARQAQVARNMANADTPGYRAADLPAFAETLQAGTRLKATRAGHIGAAEGRPHIAPQERVAQASPNGNTVSLETEMMHAAEIRQSHDMAVSVYTATRQIISTVLGRNK